MVPFDRIDPESAWHRPVKILVLSKRFYTNRDLLGDRYGRLWELPYLLACSGHQVRGFALSYRTAKEQRIGEDEGVDIEWRSFNFGFPAGIGLMRYWRQLKACIKGFRPDLIWASSDVFHFFNAFISVLYGLVHF